jgi:hypothetical protein
MEEMLIRISNADAVVEVQPDVPVFVQPHEVEEDFATFLDYIQDEVSPAIRDRPQRNVKYAQTRKTTLRSHIASHTMSAAALQHDSELNISGCHRERQSP